MTALVGDEDDEESHAGLSSLLRRIDEAPAKMSEPVSYTHLDVYKRQGTDFKGRALIGIGNTEWRDIKWNDQSIAAKKNVINSAQFIFCLLYTSRCV